MGNDIIEKLTKNKEGDIKQGDLVQPNIDDAKKKLKDATIEDLHNMRVNIGRLTDGNIRSSLDGLKKSVDEEIKSRDYLGRGADFIGEIPKYPGQVVTWTGEKMEQGGTKGWLALGGVVAAVAFGGAILRKLWQVVSAPFRPSWWKGEAKAEAHAKPAH